jgi:hypothetical protein
MQRNKLLNTNLLVGAVFHMIVTKTPLDTKIHKSTQKMKSTLSHCFVFICLLLIVTVQYISANQFIQGSISIHPSLQQYAGNFDFSVVVIELVNKQGYIKDSINSPPTGQFIVPVYDTGAFRVRLKAPSVYTFEPKEVQVEILANQQQQIDVNFVLVGFEVNGQILSEYLDDQTTTSGVSASGVKLTLVDEQNQEVRYVFFIVLKICVINHCISI